MSRGSGTARRRLFASGGAGLFVSLFLPWTTVSGRHGDSESTPGWNGYATVDGTPIFDDVGVLTGMLATLLVAWEMLRYGSPETRGAERRRDACGATLAALTCLSSVVLSFSAVAAGRAEAGTAVAGTTGNVSVGIGAVVTLMSGICLGIGASLAVGAYPVSWFGRADRRNGRRFGSISGRYREE
ncbi:hypothetical protein CLV30_13234 [Haloactinopolyspora alba]|uniref:Uncharacterized protein n=1 Tax=Haloactinopolyspora alba TaxID=648780 RepID=A0A2P8D5D1_9ACTN|nr:hypothetical protein [Haloactinopolyspora alba]PSK92418.1 hypothetical protein CLV30_13234 [Haloactinopolyspora alba]